MTILAYLAQTDPQAGQIERIVNRLLDSGDAAYVLILLGILAAVLWAIYKVFTPFMKTAQEAAITFTNASKDQQKIALEQKAVTEKVVEELETNNAQTKETLETSKETLKAVNTTNDTAKQTAADITAIKKTLDTLGENVQKLAIDSGTNTGALSEVRVKLSELADAVTAAVAKLQTPPQQTTTVNVATVPTDSSASKDQMDKE